MLRCGGPSVAERGDEMKVAVKNLENKKVKDLELPETVFDYPYKEHLVHAAVVSYLAAQRSGTHKVKGRSEVRGGGRKPWRQKGTGRARIGSLRSPTRRGGGTIFGPQPRDYANKLSVREKRNALKSALSQKLKEEGILFLDALELESHKTSELAESDRFGSSRKSTGGGPTGQRQAGVGIEEQPERKGGGRHGCQRLRRRGSSHYRCHRRGIGALGGGVVQMRIQEIIRRPLITEKSQIQRDESNTVAFEVDRRANRIDVKRAVEAQFKVKVAEVRIASMHGKVRRQGRFVGRQPDWKKAYVRLAPGEKTIEFFEGV